MREIERTDFEAADHALVLEAAAQGGGTEEDGAADSSAAGTPARAGRRFWGSRSYVEIGLGVLGIACAIGAWQWFSGTHVTAHSTIPPPADVISQLRTLQAHGYEGTGLEAEVAYSVARWAIGLGAGAVLAIPIGLLMGMNRWVQSFLGPLFAFIRPVPVIAYIPLTIVVWGIGEFPKVLLIFIPSFLYIALGTQGAARTISDVHILAAKNLGLNRRQLYTRVILPACLPGVVTSLRVGAALGWAVVVAAELVAAQHGIGYVIENASQFFQMNTVIAGIVIIGAIGITIEMGLSLLERRVVHWAGKR